MIKTISSTAVILALASGMAVAQQTPAPQATPPAPMRTDVPAAQALTSMPANASTVTHWYKQPVYDTSDNRIGEIDDALVDKEGKLVALIIGVGGFLGIGEKHVGVPFNAVRVTTKDNNKWYLVMNTTKDALKNAPGFKYDRSSTAWIAESAPATTGAPPRAQ
jgi:hypothetical protein